MSEEQEAELENLVAAAKRGEVSRRDFIQRVTALGLTASAAAAAFATADEAAAKGPSIVIERIYPNSPRVLSRGWRFKASLPNAHLLGKGKLIFKWSCEGSCSPATTNPGQWTVASFKEPGNNTLTVTVKLGGKVLEQSMQVIAEDANKYVRLGDLGRVPADAHGCPACPHNCTGPIVQGDSMIVVDGQPVAFKGARGVHSACCGPNTYTIDEGDPNVLLSQRRPAARLNDRTKHCGGTGKMVERKPAEE